MNFKLTLMIILCVLLDKKLIINRKSIYKFIVCDPMSVFSPNSNVEFIQR